jgi:hypothetical protein
LSLPIISRPLQKVFNVKQIIPCEDGPHELDMLNTNVVYQSIPIAKRNVRIVQLSSASKLVVYAIRSGRQWTFHHYVGHEDYGGCNSTFVHHRGVKSFL